MAAAQPNIIDILYKLLAGVGPTAYPAAIRKNLGMDVQQGGKPLTSGMTGFAPMPLTTRYQPRPVPTDPLVPLLPAYKPPVAPVVAPRVVAPPVPAVKPHYVDPNTLLNGLNGRNAR